MNELQGTDHENHQIKRSYRNHRPEQVYRLQLHGARNIPEIGTVRWPLYWLGEIGDYGMGSR